MLGNTITHRGMLLASMYLLPVSAVALDLNINSDSVTADIEVLDTFEAEQEHLKAVIRDKPPAYQDKVMDARTLQQIQPLGNQQDDADSAEPDGFRTWLVESRAGLSQNAVSGQASRQAAEAGIRTEYRQETRDYGEWVMQADARLRDGDTGLGLEGGYFHTPHNATGTRLTLRNQSLPVTENILADSALGDIQTELADSLTRQYRTSLGSSTVRGASTHLYNDKAHLRMGAGQRGKLTGGPYPGFEATEGSLAWAGYSQTIGKRFTAGVQFNHAAGIPPWDSLTPDSTTQDKTLRETVSSLAIAAGYGQTTAQPDNRNARLLLVQSHTDSNAETHGNANATGLFLEAGLKRGRNYHELGAYRTDPNLRFGDQVLSTEQRQGAYWQFNRQGTRMNLGGGLDAETSTHQGSGKHDKRLSANASVNYRLDRDHSLGANARTSRYTQAETGSSHSSTASLHYQTRWFPVRGQTRLSATLHRNESLVSNGKAATGEELQWEQDWIKGRYETMRPLFSTTLGLAQDRSSEETQTYPTAGLHVRQWLDPRWQVDGNLRYTSRHGNLSTSQGLAGTLSTERELGNGWYLGASASINTARVNVEADSFREARISRSNDKSAYLYARWEGKTGKPYHTIGKRQAGLSGSGSITGSVFLDSNRDGVQQADEANVPGVEIFLDEGHRAMTDPQGRFAFNQVATGKHQLMLNVDSIPLPWGVGSRNSVDVDVPLRSQTHAALPVVKIQD